MTDDDALIALTDEENAAIDKALNGLPMDRLARRTAIYRAGLAAGADRIAALTAENARFAIKTALEITDLRRRAIKAEAERDAIYRFARLNGLMAIDIDAALKAQP
jgi:hypothetical protein